MSVAVVCCVSGRKNATNTTQRQPKLRTHLRADEPGGRGQQEGGRGRIRRASKRAAPPPEIAPRHTFDTSVGKLQELQLSIWTSRKEFLSISPKLNFRHLVRLETAYVVSKRSGIAKNLGDIKPICFHILVLLAAATPFFPCLYTYLSS